MIVTILIMYGNKLLIYQISMYWKITLIMIFLILALVQILFDIRYYNSFKYLEHKKIYNIKMNNFRGILKSKFKTYSKSKILLVIEQCDKEIEVLEEMII